MQLKGFSLILNVSLPDIFQRAFDRLAWWRQILIKLTGKYASYQAQYAKQGYKPAAAARAGSGSSRGAPDAADASSSDPAAQRRPAKPAAKKKSYTRKQQESAWDEFSKTLRPK
jgi:hypothetical protein